MLKCLNSIKKNDIIDFREKHKLNADFFKEHSCPADGLPPEEEAALTHFPDADILFVHEDVYFCNALSVLGEDLPTLESALEFAFQIAYEGWEGSSAVHAFDKYSGSSTEDYFCRAEQSLKPKLCIYAGYSAEKFNGSNYSGKKGVRGSEIALIKLAEQLVGKYDVYISGPAIEDGVHNNVNYFDSNRLQFFLNSTDVEILIINRYIHFFLDFTNTARKTYLWLHDMCYQNWWQSNEIPSAGKHLIDNVSHGINGFICLTEWHKQNIIDLYGIPKDKINIVGNAIETKMFNNSIEKIPNRFIYSSLPERGLSILLDWFPDIVSELPDAELHVFTDIEKNDELVQKMENSNKVFNHGKVSYEEIIEEFKKSDVWLYPNIFLETYCTSALEAQASNCLCVTRNYGSLGEVVGSRGIVIDGDPYSQEFKNETIKNLLEILKDKSKKESLQKKAKEWAFQKTWENRALEWVEIFNK